MEILPKISANRYISRFLLVSLNLDAILQETTIHRRWERLQVMTDGSGLEDAYGVTLHRIKAQGDQKSGLGVNVLMMSFGTAQSGGAMSSLRRRNRIDRV